MSERMPNWLMIIVHSEGVGENRLQFTTRMSICLALVPVCSRARATQSKITVCLEETRGG